MEMELHAPAALPSGKEPSVPVGEKARQALKSAWTLRNRKKIFCLSRESTLGPSTVHL
jgi:hypothetical protein